VESCSSSPPRIQKAGRGLTALNFAKVWILVIVTRNSGKQGWRPTSTD